MNNTAIAWVWSQALIPHEKFLLLALAHAADEHGITQPTIDDVAEKTGFDRWKVRKLLRSLLKVGAISCVGIHPSGADRYQLNLGYYFSSVPSVPRTPRSGTGQGP